MALRWFKRGPRTAAEWFAARRGSPDEQLEARFQDWLAETSAHAEDYALCELTWEIARGPAALVPQPPSRARTPGVAVRWASVASLCAVLVAALTWISLTPGWQSWSTAAGEQRTVVLSDGTRVTLNTRTRLKARFLRHTRDIQLADGEAFFEVTKDPSRPFTVVTRLGTARALGTRFNVYAQAARMVVTTAEGRVLVRGAGDLPGTTVAAGLQAEVRFGGAAPRLQPVNVDGVLNWLNRRLDVNDQPLGSVLQEFSRYTGRPLHAATPAIADLRVSAVLRAGDVDALRATLEGAFGLEIVQRGADWLVIDPAGERASH